MKKLLTLAFILSAFATAQAQNFKNSRDSLSYAIGIMWAQNLKQSGITDINPEIIAQAISDHYAGTDKMEPKACNQLFRDQIVIHKEGQKKKNMEEGKAFLSKNGERQGVITLPSGLQYEVMKAGTGTIPKASDKVRVHYHGTLMDGTVFDSSVQRGEPAVFGVTQVIKGWVEALQLMNVGSKWKLVIPENLAYGDRGAGGQIGPYATLIFEVELLGIE